LLLSWNGFNLTKRKHEANSSAVSLYRVASGSCFRFSFQIWEGLNN
jgi:hypothetical protein